MIKNLGHLSSVSRLSPTANPWGVFSAAAGCASTPPLWTEGSDDPDTWHSPADAAGGLCLWGADGEFIRAEPPAADAAAAHDAAYFGLLDAGAVRGTVSASYASSGGRMVALCQAGGEWYITVARSHPPESAYHGWTEAAILRADADAEQWLLDKFPSD